MLYRHASSADSADFSSQADQACEYLQKTAFEMEQHTATYYQLAHAATEIAAKLGDAVANMAATMAMISDSSQKIGDIISVTDSIVFQANTESLRADSYRASADKHGHDFSVQLSEGHSLESHSQAETKKIKVLIDASVEMVESGTRLVIHAGQTMPEVMSQIKRINDFIAQIATVFQKHTFGISEFNQTVVQLEELDKQNAAMAEESTFRNQHLER